MRDDSPLFGRAGVVEPPRETPLGGLGGELRPERRALVIEDHLGHTVTDPPDDEVRRPLDLDEIGPVEVDQAVRRHAVAHVVSHAAILARPPRLVVTLVRNDHMAGPAAHRDSQGATGS